ncbi:MAG TPA: DUF1839 family protein [Burkholderiaceae bacterium]
MAAALPPAADGARRAVAIPGLSAAGHAPHALHGADATWPEKNCYVDLWIELLAALELDPHALWPCTVALDFEGDQWTFFKPPHDELRTLYGIDVQELTVWRPLAEHALEHLGAGRPLSVEVDAFSLPDTAGTDYHHRHAKTTIVLNEVDLDARRLGYFHNAGYFEARGDDFAHLLGLPETTSALEAIADWRGTRVAELGAAAVALDEGRLPLFAEFVRLGRRVARSTEELRLIALRHLATHLAFRPRDNPVRRFGERLAADLPQLRREGMDYYHRWAFGTIRQLGAAFDLAARGLAWQEAPAGSPLRAAERSFDAIGRDAKTLILKAARAVTSSRPTDLSPLLSGMAAAWDEGMAALDAANVHDGERRSFD